MDDKLTSEIGTSRIASVIEDFIRVQDFKRKSWERRWYDNNFFDDGFHYRMVSRTTGRIIDLSNARQAMGPNRSIPKASRQIRGIANLLTSVEPFPAVYPRKINRNNYPVQTDPKTGQQSSPMYDQAVALATQKAQNIGHWITNKWESLNLEQKVVLAIILSAKNSVAWAQVYPDPIKEQILLQIYDAFDVYCQGELNDSEDSPMLVKACPKFISQLKANEYFDQGQLAQLSPDNKYATSEVKEAYMQSRFGKGAPSDSTATLILKEAYIKEQVNEFNRDQINEDLEERAKEFKTGDTIIRQVFEAGGIWLRDRYLALRYYPLVPLTLEPGPLYQVPLIERFIPANKSLDTTMSRVERWLNTMVVGAWLHRKGENFEITNKAGGQEIEYDITKPEQADIQALPEAVWNYIRELNKTIEEQGAPTAALNQIPEGIRSGVAIESLKATEYANLKIATKQLKVFVKEITKRMIDIAANNFITPETVQFLDANKRPTYFDIVGRVGVSRREKIKEKIDPKITVIDPDTVVDIQIESGLGFTEQGRRETMLQINEYLLKLVEVGVVPPQALQIAVRELLHTFSFSSTQEFLQAIEAGLGTGIDDDTILKMKLAVAETLKDTGVVGNEKKQSEDRIMESKIAMAEVAKDLEQKGDNSER